MTNRKKRIQKGVDSLKEQIALHEQKKTKAEEEGLTELQDYYENGFFFRKEKLQW